MIDTDASLEQGVSQATERALGWMKSHIDQGRLKLKVESEFVPATAFSLNLPQGGRDSQVVDYIIRTKIWRTDVDSTLVAARALIGKGMAKENAEIGSAIEGDDEVPIQRRKKLAEFLRAIAAHDQSEASFRRSLYACLLGVSKSQNWYSRDSVLYPLFPQILESTIGRYDKSAPTRIRESLTAAMNEDGSYGGVTILTMKAAFALERFGERTHLSKTMSWLDSAYNGNGSYPVIIFQDVYCTVLASLALAECGELEDKTISWIDRTRVSAGYPYYSLSYVPDCDDTSLVLLLKGTMRLSDDSTRKTAQLMLKGQNPDGGWGSYPLGYLKAGGLLREYLRVYEPLFKAEGQRLPLSALLRAYRSTVEMTSKAVIALSCFKDDHGVRPAIERGVRYLLTMYREGSFHSDLRWIDSEVAETALALIALKRAGYSGPEVSRSTGWLMSRYPVAPEEAAHILWALSELGVEEKGVGRLLQLLIDSQRDDGSWDTRLRLDPETRHGDTGFSTALPLLATARFSDKRKRS